MTEPAPRNSKPKKALEPKAALAACLTGLLYFLAYPGVGWWPLGFMALVPLLAALRGQPPRTALVLGWIAGLVMSGLGFHWLLPVLRQFSGFPIAVSALMLVGLSAYQGARLGSAAWLYARAVQRGWPAGPSFAAAFVASEMAFPLLFPWYFGAVLHDIVPLIQVADLGGVMLVSVILVTVNLGVADAVLALKDRRSPFGPPLAVASMVLAATWLYGAARAREIDARSLQAPKATVGVVQANTGVNAKPYGSGEALQRHIELTRSLTLQSELDLVVWSESAEPRPIREEEAPTRFRGAFGPGARPPTLFGAVLVRPLGGQQQALFNSALLIDGSGVLVDRYDKHDLLVFGEYLPFGSVFPGLYALSPRSGRFTPGTLDHALRLDGRSIATVICYEDILPRAVDRLMGGGDVELIVNLSNDAWFGDSLEPVVHLALSKFRSVEHRRYLVRGNNSGISAVIDPVGRARVATQPFTEAAFAAEIAWLRDGTFYESLGELPGWLVTAGILGCAVLRRPARRPRRSTPQIRPSVRSRIAAWLQPSIRRRRREDLW